jgi:hypothetical protein
MVCPNQKIISSQGGKDLKTKEKNKMKWIEAEEVQNRALMKKTCQKVMQI